MTLATKKLHAAAQIAHLEANDILDEYLDTFKFPSNESRKIVESCFTKLHCSCNFNAIQTFL